MPSPPSAFLNLRHLRIPFFNLRMPSDSQTATGIGMREVRYAMQRTVQLVWTRFESTSSDRRPDLLGELVGMSVALHSDGQIRGQCQCTQDLAG